MFQKPIKLRLKLYVLCLYWNDFWCFGRKKRKIGKTLFFKFLFDTFKPFLDSLDIIFLSKFNIKPHPSKKKKIMYKYIFIGEKNNRFFEILQPSRTQPPSIPNTLLFPLGNICLRQCLSLSNCSHSRSISATTSPLPTISRSTSSVNTRRTYLHLQILKGASS